MSQQPLQVSQARVQDILKGKAATAISDLMVENAQLTAALEALTQKHSEAEQQLQALRNRDLNQRSAADTSDPGSPPAQDPSA